MGIFEAAVVFVIAWWLFFLPSLSAGGRSQAEAGEVVPGSEPGAPERWNIRRKLLLATAGALTITALVWIALALDLFGGLIPEQR